jgi:hypothetical protein
MNDLSIGRAFLGLSLSFLVVFLGAFAIAWNNPPLPPDTATIGALGAHLSRCTMAGVNAGFLALPGWLAGWAIKANRGGNLLVFKKDAEPEETPPPPRFVAHQGEGVSAKVERAPDDDLKILMKRLLERMDADGR